MSFEPHRLDFKPPIKSINKRWFRDWNIKGQPSSRPVILNTPSNPPDKRPVRFSEPLLANPNPIRLIYDEQGAENERLTKLTLPALYNELLEKKAQREARPMSEILAEKKSREELKQINRDEVAQYMINEWRAGRRPYASLPEIVRRNILPPGIPLAQQQAPAQQAQPAPPALRPGQLRPGQPAGNPSIFGSPVSAPSSSASSPSAQTFLQQGALQVQQLQQQYTENAKDILFQFGYDVRDKIDLDDLSKLILSKEHEKYPNSNLTYLPALSNKIGLAPSRGLTSDVKARQIAQRLLQMKGQGKKHKHHKHHNMSGYGRAPTVHHLYGLPTIYRIYRR
jgi:hypothetical protein